MLGSAQHVFNARCDAARFRPSYGGHVVHTSTKYTTIIACTMDEHVGWLSQAILVYVATSDQRIATAHQGIHLEKLVNLCVYASGHSNSREEGTTGKSSTGAPSVNLTMDAEMDMPDAADRGLVGAQDASASGAFVPTVGTITGLEDIYAAVPHVRCPLVSVFSTAHSNALSMAG